MTIIKLSIKVNKILLYIILCSIDGAAVGRIFPFTRSIVAHLSIPVVHLEIFQMYLIHIFKHLLYNRSLTSEYARYLGSQVYITVSIAVYELYPVYFVVLEFKNCVAVFIGISEIAVSVSKRYFLIKLPLVGIVGSHNIYFNRLSLVYRQIFTFLNIKIKCN